jgi:hypothetical protein
LSLFFLYIGKCPIYNINEGNWYLPTGYLPGWRIPRKYFENSFLEPVEF